MHPAPSVIIFTALSGLGFGLLTWLGFGYPDVTGWVAFWFFFIVLPASPSVCTVMVAWIWKATFRHIKL